MMRFWKSKPLFLRSSFRKRYFKIMPEFRQHLYKSMVNEIACKRKYANELGHLLDCCEFPPNGNTYSANQAPVWKELVPVHPSTVLEIGVWQGASTVMWANLFPETQITCIDTFDGGTQMDASVDPESSFDFNTKPFADRVIKIKSDSFTALVELINQRKKYQLIYIDALHTVDNVIVDSVLSWNLLSSGGIMLWDDYWWSLPGESKTNIRHAIDFFIQQHKNELKILQLGGAQVAIKRTNEI